MNYLEGVQALHYEAKLPGAAPTAVTGLTGRAADLARWYKQAWNDIQLERFGHWNWMRKGFTLNTVASTASYTFGNCIDVVTTVAIDRFRAWDLDPREPPLIYLLSDGEATERRLQIASWPWFRDIYVRATHDPAYPGAIAETESAALYLGPTPDGVYRVTGNYWRSNQVLALDADIPEMPVDYHMTIVYRALLKYGYNTVSQSVLARCQKEGGDIFDSLLTNQFYGRFSLTMAPPLA